MCAYVLQAGTDPATSVRSAVVLGLLSLAALSLLVPRLLGLVTGARAASRGWDPLFFASWLLAVVLGGITWSISRIAFRVPKEIETVNAWLDAAGPDIILTIFVAVAIAAGIVTYVRWTMLASKRHLKLPPGMDSKTQFTAYCAEKMRWNPVDEDSGP